MPKRRSRSIYSGSPRKSPRKSGNANANSVEDGNGEGKETRPPNVIFYFEHEEKEKMEVEINPLDPLVCVHGELSANENQVPCKDEPADFFTNRCFQNVSSCSSPLKRVSPLSPTLVDNVPQPPPPQSLNQNEVADNSHPNETVPKTEMETESSVPTAVHSTNEKPLKPRILNGAIVIKEESSKVEDVWMEVDSALVKSVPPVAAVATVASAPVELPEAVFRILDDYTVPDIPFMEKDRYCKWTPKSKVDVCKDVEYELDELDLAWLELNNKKRANYNGLDLGPVLPHEMELLMDRFEKEHYYEQQNNGMGKPAECDEDAVCCICLDGESDNSNQIIFCDMCNIPVHQDCYGVPFIPEGCWLCRRCCSIGPMADIECIFCPSKDGAFKQTIDGRWSHVLCALWIPEVRFSNPSLVEPVDDIVDIPLARWRLVCFLCKQKGLGACIQCHVRSCVTAFHASCAQKAGLSLKLETRESGVQLKPSCDKHTSEKVRDLMKEKVETVNKVLNEKNSQLPEMLFPSISKSRIEAIAELVCFPGKSWFIKRLIAFWKLKRKYRGGAPLLRNLESSYIPDESHPFGPSAPLDERPVDRKLLQTCNQNMQAMRRDLDSLKNRFGVYKAYCQAQRDHLEIKLKIAELHMQHVSPVYLQVIQQLKDKDKNEIFAEPVTVEVAPDYFTFIEHPMDLSTMETKVFALEYSSLEDLEADFLLMINNCMEYNKKSTLFYRGAVKLKKDGKRIFDEARTAQQRQIELEEQMATEKKNELERLQFNVFI